jgi:hypothetical protein
MPSVGLVSGNAVPAMLAKFGAPRVRQPAAVADRQLGCHMSDFSHAGHYGADALVHQNETQSHVCHGRSPRDQRLEAVGALDAGDQVRLAEGSVAPIARGPATLLREPTDSSRLAQAPRQRPQPRSLSIPRRHPDGLACGLPAASSAGQSLARGVRADPARGGAMVGGKGRLIFLDSISHLRFHDLRHASSSPFRAVWSERRDA